MILLYTGSLRFLCTVGKGGGGFKSKECGTQKDQKGVERPPPYALITFSQAAVVAGKGVCAAHLFIFDKYLGNLGLKEILRSALNTRGSFSSLCF